MKHEIGLRGVCLRAAEEGDGRTLEGVAVPYDSIISTWDGAETFDPDCVFEESESAKLCYQHAELIGAITSAENRDDGLHITARIADTQLGRDAVALMDEGALDSLSVGFVPLEDERDENNVTHRRRVRLLEVSLVSRPAYQNAKVENHRNLNTENSQERNHMENETIEKVRAEQAEQADVLRSIQASLATMNNHGSSNPAASYRSYGHLLKQLAKGDEQARNDYEQISKRDYTARARQQRPQPVSDQQHASHPRTAPPHHQPRVTRRAAVRRRDAELSHRHRGHTTVGKQAKEGDYSPMARSRSGHEPRPSKPTAATRP